MFLRLEDIAKVIVGKWTCVVDGQQIDIANEDVMSTYRNHLVVSIKAENNQLNLEIKTLGSPTTKVDPNEAWYQEHIKQFGTAPDLF
jgi:hypothetical protein